MRKRLRIPRQGERFGLLTVVSNDEIVGSRKACKCRCDCGREKVVRNEHLVKGQIKSCGCLVALKARARLTKHGGKGSPLYTIWKGMRERCNNPNAACADNYCNKGIRVCKEWDDFAKFREWALLNNYSKGLTLDRIDNNNGYCPSNCRWASKREQTANRHVSIRVELDGKSIMLVELAKKAGIPYGTLYDRYRRGLRGGCLLSELPERHQQQKQGEREK